MRLPLIWKNILLSCYARPYAGHAQAPPFAPIAQRFDHSFQVVQGLPPVHGYVVCLRATYFVLRVRLTTVARLAVVVSVMGMHPGDSAAGRTKFNMPADFVTNFESVHHDVVPFRVEDILGGL